MQIQLKGLDGAIWFDADLSAFNSAAALDSHWFTVTKSISLTDGYAVLVSSKTTTKLKEHITTHNNLGIDDPGEYELVHAINLASSSNDIHSIFVFEREDIAALFKLRWS
jgi:dUTPase